VYPAAWLSNRDRYRRRLLKDAQQTDPDVEPEHFEVVRNPVQATSTETSRLRTRHEVERLAALRQMGLAEATGPNRWRVRRDFERILRAMARTADMQRTLAAHGALISDQRLPIEVLDRRVFTSVEGRVLVHGQDEQTGRSYMMLEGTDAKVRFIYYTPEIEEARSRDELRINSFARFRKAFGTSMDIRDFGDAENLLKNVRHLSATARRLFERGIVPTEDGWGEWLG
jgi:hypothetical protein